MRLCTLYKIPLFLLIFSPKSRKIGVLAEVFTDILLLIYKKNQSGQSTQKDSPLTRVHVYIIMEVKMRFFDEKKVKMGKKQIFPNFLKKIKKSVFKRLTRH